MSDYYIVMRENNPKYPLLGWRQDYLIRSMEPFNIDEPIKLRVGDPVPKKYEMVDYHSLPESVISEKIKNVLEPINIYGTQLLPTTVEGEKGDVYSYYLLHIYNEISCMDKRKSKYEDWGDPDDEDDIDFDISKLVLDEDVIKTIPLEKRLVFRLVEDTSKNLFHKSIRDTIMAKDPKGIKFVDVDDWTDGSSFE